MGIFLAGAVGGAGLSPTLYKFVGAETAAVVTAANAIDKHGLPGLSIGDIVVATVDTGVAPDTQLLVLSAVNYEAGTSKLDLWPAFLGDTRATDTAGYQASNFSGNIGAGASPRLFSYRNNTDTKAVITVDGYFDDLLEVLTTDDMIMVIANDGATFLRVTGTSGGTVATTAVTIIDVI